MIMSNVNITYEGLHIKVWKRSSLPEHYKFMLDWTCILSDPEPKPKPLPWSIEAMNGDKDGRNR